MASDKKIIQVINYVYFQIIKIINKVLGMAEKIVS